LLVALESTTRLDRSPSVFLPHAARGLTSRPFSKDAADSGCRTKCIPSPTFFSETPDSYSRPSTRRHSSLLGLPQELSPPRPISTHRWKNSSGFTPSAPRCRRLGKLV